MQEPDRRFGSWKTCHLGPVVPCAFVSLACLTAAENLHSGTEAFTGSLLSCDAIIIFLHVRTGASLSCPFRFAARPLAEGLAPEQSHKPREHSGKRVRPLESLENLLELSGSLKLAVNRAPTAEQGLNNLMVLLIQDSCPSERLSGVLRLVPPLSAIIMYHLESR